MFARNPSVFLQSLSSLLVVDEGDVSAAALWALTETLAFRFEGAVAFPTDAALQAFPLDPSRLHFETSELNSTVTDPHILQT